MNERIRELWSQAGGHYNGGNQHTWPEYTITDPEKFAKLIVRDCADKAHEFIIEDGDEFPKTSVAYRIKQHFGVEE